MQASPALCPFQSKSADWLHTAPFTKLQRLLRRHGSLVRRGLPAGLLSPRRLLLWVEPPAAQQLAARAAGLRPALAPSHLLVSLLGGLSCLWPSTETPDSLVCLQRLSCSATACKCAYHLPAPRPVEQVPLC